jgi:hypothetical protein
MKTPEETICEHCKDPITGKIPSWRYVEKNISYDIYGTVDMMNKYASQFYPLEFVEWIGKVGPHRLTFREEDRKWLYLKDNGYIEFMTTAELYEYWKQNVEEKK